MGKLKYLIIIMASLSIVSCSPNLQPQLTNKTWYLATNLSKNNITVYQDSTLNPEILRGQQSILLLEDGSLLESATNANDKVQSKKGSWELNKKTLQLTLPSTSKLYTFKIINLSNGSIKLELSE